MDDRGGTDSSDSHEADPSFGPLYYPIWQRACVAILLVCCDSAVTLFRGKYKKVQLKTGDEEGCRNLQHLFDNIVAVQYSLCEARLRSDIYDETTGDFSEQAGQAARALARKERHMEQVQHYAKYRQKNGEADAVQNCLRQHSRCEHSSEGLLHVDAGKSNVLTRASSLEYVLDGSRVRISRDALIECDEGQLKVGNGTPLDVGDCQAVLATSRGFKNFFSGKPADLAHKITPVPPNGAEDLCSTDPAATVLREGHGTRSDIYRPMKGGEHADKASFLQKFIAKSVMETRGCSWKIEYDSGEEVWKKAPQSFTSAAVIGTQAFVGLIGHYMYNYMVGGWKQLRMCFLWFELRRWAVCGSLFAASSVFSFMGQEFLPPAQWGVYSKLGVVITPILWRLLVGRGLHMVTWLTVALMASSILQFCFNFGPEASFGGGIGLVFVLLKVTSHALACVSSEIFAKDDGGDTGERRPFSVQATYALPWKCVTCWLFCFLLPDHGARIFWGRDWLLFHDWNWVTLALMGFNLSDTVMSALAAKVFDSVTKSVLDVVGMIFPLFFFSVFVLKYDKIDLSSSRGQIKAFSAISVCVITLTYVAGRHLYQQYLDLLTALGEMGEEDDCCSTLSPDSQLAFPEVSGETSESYLRSSYENDPLRRRTSNSRWRAPQRAESEVELCHDEGCGDGAGERPENPPCPRTSGALF